MPESLLLTSGAEPMPFAAYAGSTLQQNFGESLSGHGFLLWDLGARTVQAFDVPNDHTLHTLTVGPGTDYDALDLVLTPSKFTHIKVNWTDYVSRLTRENKAKITRHLRERYQPVELAFRQNVVKLDAQGQVVAQQGVTLDTVSTEASQRQVIEQYLLAHQYAPEDVVAIQALHATVSERLRLSQGEEPAEGQVYEYKLQHLWLENFKSYGERVDIDWENQDGVWQITGENMGGKSTLLDAITYLFYGTMLAFQGAEREKLGDNRFINNVRELDYCEVGAYVLVNGVRYKLVRRTQRTWQKSKGVRQIKAVSTSLAFFEVTGRDAQGQEVLVDVGIDRKVETAKLVQTFFGTMADFQRSSLINADTLTGLLSINHAVFVDALLRDIGLDVFERLLKEFKAWRDETYARAQRLQLDPAQAAQEISELDAEIVFDQASMQQLSARLAEVERRLSKGEEYLSKTLYPRLQFVRPELVQADPEALRAQIHQHLLRIEALRDQMRDEKAGIEAMVTCYDPGAYEALLGRREAHQELISQLRAQLRTHEIARTEAQHQVALVQGRVSMRERDIAALADWQRGEEARLTREAGVIEREVQHLETSKTCPTCKREKNAEVLEAIGESIARKQQELGALTEQRLALPGQRVQKEQQIRADMALIAEEKEPFYAQGRAIEAQWQAVKDAVDAAMVETVDISSAIQQLATEKAIWERRARREADYQLLPIKIENLELQGQSQSRLLTELEAAQAVLDANQAVQLTIDRAQERLRELQQEKRGYSDQLAVLGQSTIPQKQRAIARIQASLTAFAEQERRDYLLKAYEKCLHRDGVPTMLLKQYLGVINVELNNLLDGMKFTLFLNEELQFKMFNHVREDAVMNVMQGSGMQKTFTSLVLRLALRQVNNRFRGNLLLMDEILGRLDAKHLDKFSELLARAKENIDKLVIIEHGYGETINPDHLVHVTTDKQGVSTLQVLA